MKTQVFPKQFSNFAVVAVENVRPAVSKADVTGRVNNWSIVADSGVQLGCAACGMLSL